MLNHPVSVKAVGYLSMEFEVDASADSVSRQQ